MHTRPALFDRRALVAGAAAFSTAALLPAAAWAEETEDSAALVGGAGSATGKGGELSVEVLLQDGKLVDIVETRSHETGMVGQYAQEVVKGLVLENQTLNVDCVSGATITYFAYMAAIKEALAAAGEDTDEWSARDKALAAPTADIPESVDVLIIGSGSAGLSAAIVAAKEGKSVLVLEKLGVFGGSTAFSGFGYAAPGCYQQVAKGIEDSPDALAEDMLVGGDNEGNPELVHILCDSALDSFQWLTYECGFSWYPFVVQEGGHSVARSLCPVDYGAAAVEHLYNRANELGVSLANNTRVTKLLQDGDGVVNGVEAENLIDGSTYRIDAKAVVLATGGFGANVDMRVQYNPEYDDSYGCTDCKGADGDGILLAQDLGANLVDMSFIQTHPTGNIVDGTMLDCGGVRTSGCAILVNKEGHRYVEELERRDVCSQATLAQTDGVGYFVLTKADADAQGYNPETYDETAAMYANGIWSVGDTLEEACAQFGIDAAGVAEAIETWNADCASGTGDSAFGYRSEMHPIGEGPYVIFPIVPVIHYTMGGVQITANAEVVDENGAVIPGLYAAGEVTGDIMGTNRLGTTAVVDTVVFGRIAGMNAAHFSE